MGYKKIRMTSRSAGPNGILNPGEVRKVDAKRASRLVEGGYAVYMEENAAREPRENAAKRTGRTAEKGDGLEEKTYEELYEIAQERDIQGRSGLPKDELVELIRNA